MLDLPTRLEEDFAEIENDIVVDLRKSNIEYVKIQSQITELNELYPKISNVVEGKGDIYLTEEEHIMFIKYIHLNQKLDEMERLQIYFHGHTDAVAYLKKFKAF